MSEAQKVAAKCADIADAQLEYWREEKRLRGNYRVLSGLNECQRVADAIRAEFGLDLKHYDETGWPRRKR